MPRSSVIDYAMIMLLLFITPMLYILELMFHSLVTHKRF